MKKEVKDLLAKTLIIVPAYNEAANLRATLRELRETWPGLDVLVVDDDSRDDTAAVARDGGARIAHNPVNLGYGGAVQTGFRFALAHGYVATVGHDADGQHDPRYLEALVAPLAAGEADLTIGSRLAGPKRAGYRPSGARALGVWYFSVLTSLLAGKRYRDVTSGQQACNRRALAFFAEFFPNDFPDAQAILAAHRAGLRIREVPVTMRPRLAGVSTTNRLKSLAYPFIVTVAVWVEFFRHRSKVPTEARDG